MQLRPRAVALEVELVTPGADEQPLEFARGITA
jgi:hypothetical protein